MTIDAIVKTKTLQSPLGPPASVILMPKHINQQFTMQQGYNDKPKRRNPNAPTPDKRTRRRKHQKKNTKNHHHASTSIVDQILIEQKQNRRLKLQHEMGQAMNNLKEKQIRFKKYIDKRTTPPKLKKYKIMKHDDYQNTPQPSNKSVVDDVKRKPIPSSLLVEQKRQYFRHKVRLKRKRSQRRKKEYLKWKKKQKKKKKERKQLEKILRKQLAKKRRKRKKKRKKKMQNKQKHKFKYTNGKTSDHNDDNDEDESSFDLSSSTDSDVDEDTSGISSSGTFSDFSSLDDDDDYTTSSDGESDMSFSSDGTSNNNNNNNHNSNDDSMEDERMMNHNNLKNKQFVNITSLEQLKKMKQNIYAKVNEQVHNISRKQHNNSINIPSPQGTFRNNNNNNKKSPLSTSLHYSVYNARRRRKKKTKKNMKKPLPPMNSPPSNVKKINVIPSRPRLPDLLTLRRRNEAEDVLLDAAIDRYRSTALTASLSLPQSTRPRNSQVCGLKGTLLSSPSMNGSMANSYTTTSNNNETPSTLLKRQRKLQRHTLPELKSIEEIRKRLSPISTPTHKWGFILNSPSAVVDIDGKQKKNLLPLSSPTKRSNNNNHKRQRSSTLSQVISTPKVGGGSSSCSINNNNNNSNTILSLPSSKTVRKENNKMIKNEDDKEKKKEEENMITTITTTTTSMIKKDIMFLPQSNAAMIITDVKGKETVKDENHDVKKKKNKKSKKKATKNSPLRKKMNSNQLQFVKSLNKQLKHDDGVVGVQGEKPSSPLRKVRSNMMRTPTYKKKAPAPLLTFDLIKNREDDDDAADDNGIALNTNGSFDNGSPSIWL